MSRGWVQTTGLSGDLGWNEADAAEGTLLGLGTSLLVLATGAVWGAVWVTSGLPPLLSLANMWKSEQA